MKKRQYKRLISFALTAALVIILALFYWAIWNYVYLDRILLHSIPYGPRGQILAMSIYVAILTIFSSVYLRQGIEIKRIADIVVSQSLTVAFTNFITYFQICLMAHGFISPLPMLLLTAVDLAAVVIWAVAAKGTYRRLYPAYRMLLIYSGSKPTDIAGKFSSRFDRYSIAGYADVSDGDNGKLAEQFSLYDAVIITDRLDAGERETVISLCFENSMPAYVCPSFSDLILGGADNSNIFDSPILVCQNFGLRAENRFFKRLLDLVLIIPIAVVMSPIMLIIALLIKCYDGGTVFYKQQRLTEDGKVFWIYKFRSMMMNSEAGKAQLAKKNDSRITPIGKVLRAIHFDELPQIINILKGEMSIVGPRPERPEIAEQYCQILPQFKYRLKVKAGLTGYAQVFGKYNTHPVDKLKLDLYYIEHQNLLLDIELILKTVKILFEKDNTEGIEAWQITAADCDEKSEEQITHTR